MKVSAIRPSIRASERVEVVLVDALQSDNPVASHRNPVLDHQPGEGRSVEQHNTLGEVLAILPGLPGKCGRRDEYTLSCAPLSQSAEERLDFRSHRLCRRRMLDQGA